MQVFNLINPEHSKLKYQKMIFPDGQPHIKADPSSFDNPDGGATILSRIANPNDLMYILIAKDILEHAGFRKINLKISYLMAARMDRVMVTGEALTLKVVTNIINAQNFNNVEVFDPHSEVSTALIDHSTSITNHAFVKDCIHEHMGGKSNFWIVSPDGGALKKIHKVAEYLGGVKVAECMKTRDVKTGALSGFKSMVEDFNKEPCFIVDDICDGGGTFSGLGALLKEKNAGEVVLIVSHGVFSKGFDIASIDKIYTTNSFRDITDEKIKTFPIEKYL